MLLPELQGVSIYSLHQVHLKPSQLVLVQELEKGAVQHKHVSRLMFSGSCWGCDRLCCLLARKTCIIQHISEQKARVVQRLSSYKSHRSLMTSSTCDSLPCCGQIVSPCGGGALSVCLEIPSQVLPGTARYTQAHLLGKP